MLLSRCKIQGEEHSFLYLLLLSTKMENERNNTHKGSLQFTNVDLKDVKGSHAFIRYLKLRNDVVLQYDSNYRWDYHL